MGKKIAQVVTIAGIDSGGGAGIQADLKTFQMRGVYGMNIVVALTAQNTLGVQDAMPVPIDFINEQFRSLASDFEISACKTGMLFDKEHVLCVVENLKRFNFGQLVVDPVMVAKGGHQLLSDDAIEVIKTELLPLATLVTPNLPEVEVLVGYGVTTEEEMIHAAKELQQLGVKNVIVKGGHLEGDTASDCVLLETGELFFMSAPRINTKNTHGTGDTFSACIVSELAKGLPIKEAIILARQYVQGTIEDGIAVGHGHGPLNHWANVANTITVQ